MTVIVVSGTEPGIGATTVAAGLAHRLAYAGYSVRIERLGSGPRAEADAAALGMLEFADASGTPVDSEAMQSSPEGVTVVDASSLPDAGALATRLGARLLLVTSSADTEGAPGDATTIINHARRGALLQLPEDRLLAAPTVGDLITASNARVLARSIEGERALCEHIVIGAISHDSDQPYFARFPRKVVVTRSEKVDIALSALRTDAECLILTGGSDPSPYLIDRVASGRSTTLLLAPEGTVETVRDIEGTFGRSAFAGEAKAERAGALMAAAIDDAALERLLGS
jgi:BioD-like phosphotransacetylase family protein